eukprot:GHVT01026335.1.p1 GENE.GHVT01026335.1~~GHVT01026335.1.p1  ORF type:complete len:407 (+),score=31.63 GHVT01026335.1:456-1676(+)
MKLRGLLCLVTVVAALVDTDRCLLSVAAEVSSLVAAKDLSSPLVYDGDATSLVATSPATQGRNLSAGAANHDCLNTCLNMETYLFWKEKTPIYFYSNGNSNTTGSNQTVILVPVGEWNIKFLGTDKKYVSYAAAYLRQIYDIYRVAVGPHVIAGMGEDRVHEMAVSRGKYIHNRVTFLVDIGGLGVWTAAKLAKKHLAVFFQVWKEVNVGASSNSPHNEPNVARAVIVNAARAFRASWSMVSTLVPHIRRRAALVHLLGSLKEHSQSEALFSALGAESLPLRYGGTCTTPIRTSPYEVEFIRYFENGCPDTFEPGLFHCRAPDAPVSKRARHGVPVHQEPDADSKHHRSKSAATHESAKAKKSVKGAEKPHGKRSKKESEEAPISDVDSLAALERPKKSKKESAKA